MVTPTNKPPYTESINVYQRGSREHLKAGLEGKVIDLPNFNKNPMNRSSFNKWLKAGGVSEELINIIEKLEIADMTAGAKKSLKKEITERLKKYSEESAAKEMIQILEESERDGIADSECSKKL